MAKDMFRSLVDSTSRELSSDDLVFVLSGDSNFRYTLDPSYKSNRKGSRKPIVYRELAEWLRGEYPGRVVSKPVLEADDYLGILSTSPTLNGVERIIVSEDKDLLTVPGKLYRKGELLSVSEEEADDYWRYQTLTGDPTDGYKGCPGVGPVKAKQILAKPGNPWENVRQTFLKAGLTEENVFLQASLSHICRFADWDSESQTVRPLTIFRENLT